MIKLTDNAVREGYEALRAQVTGEGLCLSTPRGLALFLRSGMVAWARALSEPASASARVTPSRTERLATGARSEIAVVVAGMALSAWKEGGNVS